jgi:DNA (cytosine-5)-methyltransferase 1
MTAYYNEIDAYAAQWLRNLIAAKHIAAGEVDERSICDVAAEDLADFTQCHFFAGIGVWSHALRLAGWPDDRPVWTGSCPCQPFSAAGKRGGFDDERHLWPELFRLVRERRPAIVFGEQVASKDGLEWLDTVQADLEGAGYASAAADLCAAGVGAPHIRQRLYWVADAESSGHGEHQRDTGAVAGTRGCDEGQESQLGRLAQAAGDCGEDGRMANNNNKGLEGRRQPERERGTERAAGSGGLDGGLADADSQRHEWRTTPSGLEARPGAWVTSCGKDHRPSPTHGHWRDADWLFCRDGKWRPVEPGTFPLAHGAAARVGRLRAYGNAIVPQVAQAFVEAFMECRP